jgi:hypothetical protein
MQEINMNNNVFTTREKAIIYVAAFAFMANLFIFLALFVEIVFPNLRRSGVWNYLQLGIGLALFFAVAENLKKYSLGTFLLFNAVVAMVNAFAVWRHFYLH